MQYDELLFLLLLLLLLLRILLLLLLLLEPGRVLAFSTSLFHFFLFLVNSFQFFTLSTSISLRIPSILGSSYWSFSKWFPVG